MKPNEFKVSGLLFQYRGLLLVSAVSAIVFSSMALTLPRLLQIAIDRVIPNRDVGLFAAICLIMILIYIMRFIMRMVTGFLGTYTVTRMLLDVRQRIFKHLQSLSLRFYEEYRTGKLISNVISDVSLLQSLITLCISMVEQVFMMLLVTGMIFFINWQIGLITLLILPFHFINFYYFGRILRRQSMKMQEKMSEISANLAENINGIKVVKSFSKERSESLQFFISMRPTVDIAVDMNKLGNISSGSYEMLMLFTYLAVIGIGMGLVSPPGFTLGAFVAVYTYVGLQVNSLAALSSQISVISQGMAGAQRIINLLRVIPEIKDDSEPLAAGCLKGNIDFNNVSFRYKDIPVISNFTLHISSGQKIALVGSSGCGKTTISNLLLRFYDVVDGCINVDGVDIRKYSQISYRNNIGVVLQEPFLFSGTIGENIAYARPDASQEEIIRAAEQANVTEFVSKLNNGYDSIIGENGVNLSGGQKQRIAIARAVLKNPRILVLDEATSALDTVSEYLVQDALDNLMRDRTTIIIAHRLSTVKNADLIVVMDNGSVKQMGTHNTLINQEGIYKDLYFKQEETKQNSRFSIPPIA